MQPSNIIANRAARYRSVVRLYAEAGARDLGQVPEIETDFKELGHLAGLDFEEVRRELGEPEKKERGRPPRNDVLLMADLPDPFSWRDVAEIWGVNRREAFDRLNKIVEKNLAYAAGSGSYRVMGRREETRKAHLTSAEGEC